MNQDRTPNVPYRDPKTHRTVKPKIRTEPEIRADLAQQIKEVFDRFEVWKCR